MSKHVRISTSEVPACDHHKWPTNKQYTDALERGIRIGLEEAAKHRLIKFDDDLISHCSCGWNPNSCDIASEWEQHIRSLDPAKIAEKHKETK